MTIFQFDQCFNDKKLARDCTNQGRSVAWCFPKRLIDKEDPEVLADLMAKSNPLVTFDIRMAQENTAYIPESNPGMLIISNGRGSHKTMRRNEAKKVLVKFKEIFQQWDQVCWTNSIVEITLTSVEVWRVVGGKMQQMLFSEFTNPTWANDFANLLERNAVALPNLPPSQPRLPESRPPS